MDNKMRNTLAYIEEVLGIQPSVSPLAKSQLDKLPMYIHDVSSPEKALCDKIILTPKVNLRSTIQTHDFLLEDLRIDQHELQKLNAPLIESWIVDSPKKSSLKFLAKSLTKL